MITVADIVSLPAFTHYEMLAPVEGGMAREVNTVGIMDSAPAGDEYDDFFPGDFVVTNLGFARTDPALAERSLCVIMRCGVAAVAVRTPYDVPISLAAIEESSRLGVPPRCRCIAWRRTMRRRRPDLRVRRGRLRRRMGACAKPRLALSNASRLRAGRIFLFYENS